MSNWEAVAILALIFSLTLLGWLVMYWVLHHD